MRVPVQCILRPAPAITFTRPTDDKGHAVGSSSASWLLAESERGVIALRIRASRNLRITSNAKERLDATMLAIACEEAEARGDDPEGVKIEPWRLHDLRRTGSTIMADRLGIPPHIVEAVLNH